MTALEEEQQKDKKRREEEEEHDLALHAFSSSQA